MKNPKANKLIFIIVITIVIVIFLALYFLKDASRKVTLITPVITPDNSTIDTVQSTSTPTELPEKSPSPDKPYKFLEVMDGCDIHSEGVCVNMRSGPGTKFPIILGLRTGIVLSVEKTVKDSDGNEWLKVQFVNQLVYPERVKGDLYVAASVVRTFFDEGNITKIDKSAGPITKKIVVNVTEQMLYAYDGDILFMKEPVSTGLKDTPTKVGKYSIYKKTPARYMQGASDGQEDQYYDLPGVPWNLYFSYDGDVIHGAYWHNSFGQKWSHGCVNMPPQIAKKLYEWAVVGTPVIVEE